MSGVGVPGFLPTGSTVCGSGPRDGIGYGRLARGVAVASRDLPACLLLATLAFGCGRAPAPTPSVPVPLSSPRAAAAQSLAALAIEPIPRVEIATPKVPEGPVYRGAYRFSDDWFTGHLPVWKKALGPYMGKPGLRYLEVGAYEGRSLLWMIENVLTEPGSLALAIDPLLGDYATRLRTNIASSGRAERIELIVGYSQAELRKLPFDAFDVAYVDGSHKTDDVLEDAVLIWRLVRPGGLLIFDDYERTRFKSPTGGPGPALDVFYSFYGRHFELVHRGYQLILRRRPA